MKIVTKMHIEDLPGGIDKIEPDGDRVRITSDELILVLTLPELIEFRDALNVMIDHMQPNSAPEHKPDPETVVDGVGDTWYRAPNGCYTIYRPGSPGHEDACWTIARIRETYGLAGE